MPIKKIFKVGDYGIKGAYTKEELEKWIGKEAPITAGHVGDWKKAGYPLTAIPVAGTCKVTGVNPDGFVEADFSYNSLGESLKDKYPGISSGIDGEKMLNHVAILGYAPPHIKDLDTSFSEFNSDLTMAENIEGIEFAEGGESGQTLIDKAVETIRGLDLNDSLNFEALQDVIWERTDLKRSVEKLKKEGYTVEKTAEFSKDTLNSIAATLGLIVTAKPVNTLTAEEIYAKAKAEFTRDAEKEETKKKIISIFPSSLHKVMEFAVNKAFEEDEYSKIIEFSETDKSSMATVLKEFTKEDSPFKQLFKNITGTMNFSEEDGTAKIVEEAKKLINSI